MEKLIGCSQMRINGYDEFYNSIDAVMKEVFRKSITVRRASVQGTKCIKYSKTQFKTNNKNNVGIITNVVEFVKELVTLDGKDIWIVGGSHIISISILINANFINEIVLSIHPMILGHGTPLFKDIEQQVT